MSVNVNSSARREAELDAIAADFELLDDWEDKYRHVIELGRAIAPLPELDRTGANRVQGCASQVWVVAEGEEGPDGPVLRFRGDSDAHIVRGLVALALAFYSGRTPQDILAADAMGFFRRLGLADHLTQQRANGLRALIERIRFHASRAGG